MTFPANIIAVTTSSSKLISQASLLSKKLNLPLTEYNDNQYPFVLKLTEKRLELISTHEKFKPVYVDFIAGKLLHRYFYGGGKQQLIAKATGLRDNKNTTVLDLTAGLGQDAFILASLGCNVTMLERSPIIVALLEDGLQRGLAIDWFKSLKLSLIHQEAKEYLKKINADNKPDIIYLDPMYPHRNQSALAKKEMRIIRQIVGDDEDATELLTLALEQAKKRVVVKRPRLAEILGDKNPDIIYKGKSSRFDVYLQCSDYIAAPL